MAEAFLQVLLDNLSSLIQNEIGIFMGVDAEMKKISSTLTTIQVVLEDAEDKQLESKPIRNWLWKLDDLVYEIDDVLDECATEVSKSQHKSSKLNHYSLKKILKRLTIGKRIKKVTNKLDAVAAERTKFHLCEMVVERQSKVAITRETGSILNELDLVYGRDEEKEKIVDILVNVVRDSQQLSVLPILGIGGLGKTTLAQLVFNDPRVTEHFEKKLWVCVSDNFDIKTLVKAMIESATQSGNTSNLVHLDALQVHLRELLNQKRYLMILDDVWNYEQEKWAKLKDILACGSRGSSIVVTTRLRKVADIMGTLEAHRLADLSDEHCWLLLRQRAFGQEMEEHPSLEAIGKEIVKKCVGVPLAAKALGGLLRFKRKENEWVYVKESEIGNLPHEEALILPALRLSYHHLPLQLRQCFAYCAVFPKGHKMEKEELIFHLMAHGYISSNGRMDVEDIGNEVWNELVLRSLFQDVSSNYNRKTTFKMHDLVHDLAQSIMENKVPGVQTESSNRNASNSSKIRLVHLREHFVAFPINIQLDMDMSSILMKFSCLRMLDASRTGMEDLPSAIGNLKRLRYLNLSSSKFRILPNSICHLWNLQILILDDCKKLVHLPKQVRYMNNLRHLFLNECTSLSQMPPNMGELVSLRTLSVFIVGHGSSNQLSELQRLYLGGRLEIRHLERVKNHADAKKANLGEKLNIRDLVLRWEGENGSEPLIEMDEKVLEALEPHPNLETLKIYGFKGRCFPPWTRMQNIIEIHIEDCPNCLRLPPLGDLPRLKFLKLRNLVTLEYIMEDDVLQGVNPVKTKFPLLEDLELSSLPNLKGLLKEEEGEMFPDLQNLSNLKRLYVRNVSMHSLSIEGLRGLKSLTELIISNCDTLTCLPDRWLRRCCGTQSHIPPNIEIAREILY